MILAHDRIREYAPFADRQHEQEQPQASTHADTPHTTTTSAALDTYPVVTIAHEEPASDQSDQSERESEQEYEQQQTNFTCWDYLLCSACRPRHAADYNDAIRSEQSHDLEAVRSELNEADQLLADQLHALHVSHAASQRRLEEQMAALRSQMSEMQLVLCSHMDKLRADQVSIRHRQIAIGDMQSAQLAAEARGLMPPRGATSTTSSILRGLISPRQSGSPRKSNFAPHEQMTRG